MTEKVIRDGRVAVLISPGYGGGWSTWCEDNQREAALFDRRFVEAAEAGVEDIEPIAKEVFGEDAYFFCGGWCDIQIEWVPVKTRFRVEEYDGSERLRTMDGYDFFVA